MSDNTLVLVWSPEEKSFKVGCVRCTWQETFAYGYLEVSQPDRGGKATGAAQALAAWRTHYRKHDVGPLRQAAEVAKARAYAKAYRR
jgi:hypothetical protein